MNDAHQALGEVGLIEAGGDPHIARHATTEGVDADILTAAIEIETEQLHHLPAQGALLLRRERSLRHHDRFVLLLFAYLVDEFGQPALELAEQLVDRKSTRLNSSH